MHSSTFTSSNLQKYIAYSAMKSHLFNILNINPANALHKSILLRRVAAAESISHFYLIAGFKIQHIRCQLLICQTGLPSQFCVCHKLIWTSEQSVNEDLRQNYVAKCEFMTSRLPNVINDNRCSINVASNTPKGSGENIQALSCGMCSLSSGT